jgi:ATP/maltotriose-dependent transcriptional regulator MalT
VIVVSAPAGFGKMLLAAECGGGSPETAWISLDADNDPGGSATPSWRPSPE